MSETQPTHSTITSVSVYFTDRHDVFPTGAWFAFHRCRGDQKDVLFHTGSASTWLELQRLINTTPGRIYVYINGFEWHPHQPDFFRLDTHRLQDLIMHVLREGEWLFDDEGIGLAQRCDFAHRIVNAMRDGIAPDALPDNFDRF